MPKPTTDLTGKVVYIRHADTDAPLPGDTDFDALVGDGKLVARPNDVVAGRGSKWVHPRDDRYVYGVYGRQYREWRKGKNSHTRCMLVLPGEWWLEQWNERGRNAFVYADVAYKLPWGDGEAVYAARFVATRRPIFFGLTRKDLRIEFSSTGGELTVFSTQ